MAVRLRRRVRLLESFKVPGAIVPMWKTSQSPILQTPASSSFVHKHLAPEKEGMEGGLAPHGCESYCVCLQLISSYNRKDIFWVANLRSKRYMSTRMPIHKTEKTMASRDEKRWLSKNAKIRRGHFHHYWTGPRDGDRKLIMKWLPPTWINPDLSNLISTVHEA